MSSLTAHEKAIFGEAPERCPETGRAFETGFGALSKEQQTASFIRDRDRAGDMPIDGEACPQTGRAFEVGSGAQTRTLQTARFLREETSEVKPSANSRVRRPLNLIKDATAS
ncbi:hypothetical protein V1283_003305 [Bradyrhizobium sp. AZCC 2262]|uniref:hypothetical protein n=1 Tax=Bradyrhizobium sp. AZCC 2262 TaxID=3117022 RepID=UPI002FEF8D54